MTNFLPTPWGGRVPIPHPGGRPRKQRLLFADYVMARKHLELGAAYERVAAKWGIDVDSVKRQIAREKRWAKRMDAHERAEREGGVLGK
jgi:hypothetical protein